MSQSSAIIHDRGTETSRVVDAPSERVFKAFSDPEQLARWWGPEGFTNTFEVFEFQEGGQWRFIMHGPDGTNYPNEVVFRRIVPGESIELDHVCPPYFTARLTYESLPDGKTKVTFAQTFETPEVWSKLKAICLPSNEQNLDRLQAVLAQP